MLEGGLGTIEYDCASGTIDTPVIPAPDGSFAATGTHRTGQGGPIRVGQIFTSDQATYAGKIEKDHMTLSVRLEDGTMIGPFSLDRGDPGQLTRCLAPRSELEVQPHADIVDAGVLAAEQLGVAHVDPAGLDAERGH